MRSRWLASDQMQPFWLSPPALQLRLLAWRGLMSYQEYLQIYQAIIARRPCNLLVFGRGRDSAFWTQANRAGRSAFLEDDPIWNTPLPGAQSYLVQYETLLTQREQLLSRYQAGDREALALHLPAEVENTRWDIILVDGPAGHSRVCPGRMKSIATAVSLRADKWDVFIHDINRPAEKTYADFFFGDQYETVGILRHYRS